jgi:L-amino acid N-acyltransferase YncA
MDYIIRSAVDSDAAAITAIYNYFAANSFAAYPSKPIDQTFFERFKALAAGYPFYVVESPEKQVVGFAQIRPYHPADTLQRTAEITYFILPEHTGHGLGAKLLQMLEIDARQRGIDTILASISSFNVQSLNFHRKHGFSECGRFKRVGLKFGKEFDIIWVQKSI